MIWLTSLIRKIDKVTSNKLLWVPAKIVSTGIAVAKRHEILNDSRALSYTFILSLVPLLVIAFTFFKFFGGLTVFLDSYLKPFLSKNFPPDVAAQLNTFIDALFTNMSTGTIGAVSFATLITTVIALFMSIEVSLNRIFEAKSQRPLLRRIGSYWILLSATPLIFILSAIKSSELIDTIIPSTAIFSSTGVVNSIRFIIGHVVQIFGFAALYRVLPERKLSFTAVLCGAIVTHLIFQVLASINVHFAAYVFSDQANLQLYGSIPLLVLVLLIWVRLVWLAILFGACLCSVIEKHLGLRHKREKKEPWDFPAETLLSCVSVLSHHITSFRLHKNPQTTPDVMQSLRLQQEEIEQHHERLVRQGFLFATQFDHSDCFIPTIKALRCHKNPGSLLYDLLDVGESSSFVHQAENKEPELIGEIQCILSNLRNQ